MTLVIDEKAYADATAAQSILRMIAQRYGCDPVARGEHALRGVLYAVDAKVKALGDDLVRANEARLVAERERDELRALVHTPQIAEFLEAVRSEAAHQKTRWPKLDATKLDADWGMLVVDLATKAHFNVAERVDDADAKKLHRIVTVAAAAFNWFEAQRALQARNHDTTWTPEETPPPPNVSVAVDEQ